MKKPERIKGTRDFLPQQTRRRQYIFDTLRTLFQTYGYAPIETPALEALSTLTGQYGEEGDKLLFKIRSNRNLLNTYKEQAEHLQNALKQVTGQEYDFVPHASDTALRYDLTIPFARFVVMHRNDLALPFKRCQIQPVWRGDNPQHGRYREFFQCDVDVVGSDSLLYEAELAQIYDQAFERLGIEVIIRLSNRKILEGIAAYCGHPDKFMPITVVIDKLDKIGRSGVEQELAGLGVYEPAAGRLFEALQAEDLETLRRLFAGIEVGLKGVEELQTVLDFLQGYEFKNRLRLDFSLARGLSYYTGCIYEVVVDTSVERQASVKMGSIGGGGRYANLTGSFGLPGVSGVGISFGADRIYDVLEQLDAFSPQSDQGLRLLFAAMGTAELQAAFRTSQKLRQAGIATDVYPEATKFKKALEYANKIGVPYLAIVGSEELQQGKISLKNMDSGLQYKMSPEEIIAHLSN